MHKAIALVMLGLGACSTTSTTNFDKVVTVLHDDGCAVSISISAQAGAVNPGSGFQAQGDVNCPGTTTGTTPPATTPPAAKGSFHP